MLWPCGCLPVNPIVDFPGTTQHKGTHPESHCQAFGTVRRVLCRFLWHVVGKRLNLMRNKQVGDEQRHIIISTHNVIRHRVEAAYWGIGSSLGWGGNGVVTESVYFNITLRWRMQVSRRNCNILAISGGKAQLDFTALLGIHPSIPSPSTHQPSVLCKQAEEEEAP